MSIPNPFNPLGTLGSAMPAYVKDGLILWFDALLEAPGIKDSLTNWASGSECQFTNTLTVENGVITNKGDASASFNKRPLKPIDGNDAYGENYSADLCAQTGLEISGFISGLPWADNTSLGDGVPCWQFYSNLQGYKTWLRINSSMTNYAYPYTFAFDDYDIKSLHLEFAKLFIDGEEIQGTMQSGANGGATLAIGVGTRLFSYRLYNRKLTVEEQMHNYAIDKKRFGVVDV